MITVLHIIIKQLALIVQVAFNSCIKVNYYLEAVQANINNARDKIKQVKLNK